MKTPNDKDNALAPEFGAVNVAAQFGISVPLIHADNGGTLGGGAGDRRVFAVNDDRFTGITLSEPLTAYVQGVQDQEGIADLLDFLFPPVSAGNDHRSRLFEYLKVPAKERFIVLEDDADKRSPGQDFKAITREKAKASGKTFNKGLAMRLDDDDPDYDEQSAAAHLLGILQRTELARGIALLAANAVSAGTPNWNTGTPNPDLDFEKACVAYGEEFGVAPNRLAIGNRIWLGRQAAYDALDTSGATARGAFTLDQFAGFLSLGMGGGVRKNPIIAQSRKTAKSLIQGNNVAYLFNSLQGLTRFDPSATKCFYTPTATGNRYAVHVWEVGPKCRMVAVEHYSDLQITAVTGVKKITATLPTAVAS